MEEASRAKASSKLEDGESFEMMSWCLREAIDDRGGLDSCRRGCLEVDDVT